MPRNRSWDEIRREMSLDEDHVAAFGRLGEAEERAREARLRRGITDTVLAARLGIEESALWDPEGDGDLFLAALGRHLAAAGGHLELRAVFPDEEVVLLREPPAEG